MVDSSKRRPAHGGDEALREAIELFYFSYRAFTAGPDALLAQRGLGRVHHRILYFVGRYPDIAVHALLTLLAVTKQALHAPLRQLLEGGFVSVRPDETDRRFRRLRLTDKGRQLEAQLSGTQMKQLGGVFAAAGGEAAAHWKWVMRAVAERCASAG
jgi:DNA-binding MarR family transcriptional regulator